MNDWFRNYFCVERSITKNKTFHLEILRHAFYIFSFSLDLTLTGEDHAGPSIELNLFGYEIQVGVRDNRHWNYDKDCWEVYA